jgi:type III secretion protein T
MNMEAPGPVLQALLFASARLFALFLTFSLLDAGGVKGMVRAAFIISLSSLVVPHLVQSLPAGLDMVHALVLLTKETALGALMGYFANQIFWAVQSVGSIVDQQSGIGMASVIDPINNSQEGPTPGMLNQLLINLMLAGGGFLGLMRAVYDSYLAWPVFSMAPRFDGFFERAAIQQWASLSETVVRWCAPALVMMMFVEIALGLVQRFLTTLNVFFFSQVLKVAMALFVFVLLIASSWDTLVSTMDPQAMVRLLFKTRP